MKYLKYILYTVAVLLLLAGAGVGYIAATFDPNAYKDELTALVQAKTGRALAIEGDIGLMLFPRIGIQLGRTTLSEYRSDAEFAGIERARVALALLPLLSRNVVVDQVVLEGLRASIIKRKDGSTNLDDLLAGEPEPGAEQAAPPTAGSQPIKVDVKGVRVADAAISFRDEQAGTRYSVSALMLQTGRIAPGVPTDLELSARFQADAPPLDLAVRMQGSLEAEQAQQSLRMTNLRATVEGKHGVELIELTLEAPAVSAASDKAAAALLTLALSTRGPQGDASVILRISGGQASPNALAVEELVIEVDARRGESALKGKLATPLSADLDKQALVLPAISGTLDVRSPALPVQPLTVPLSGKARVDLSKQSVYIDLAAKFDQSNLRASVGMSDFARPRLRFDAAVDRLDLDRYTSGPRPAATGGQAGGGGEKETPLDLSPLKNLNLTGRARIGELVAAKVKASNVRIDVKAQAGRLLIDPLLADLYRGRVRGSIGVDADGNRFAVKQSLSGVAIGPLLKDALAQDLLDGRGDIALDLTAAGPTVDALIRSLSGDTNLKLADGAIKGINLAQSLRSARNALSLSKDSETAAAAGEKTDFSELTASFSIDNGKARNEDLSVKSPFLRLNGAGGVDLVQGELDYLAKVTVVASAAGQGGKDLADLAGLTVPIRVSGPLTAPRFKLEFSSALAGRAKSEIGQKKEALKSKLESRLQEKLQGDKPPASGGEAAGAGSAAPEPQPLKPEDELKRKLRGLLR
jgi:AsmA protein